MAKRAMTKKIPFMGVMVLAVVVAGSVFLWNFATGKMAKPLNSFILPLVLVGGGAVAFFFKPARKIAGPLLLAGGAVAGLEIGTKAVNGTMSRPSAYRYRVGQNRPTSGVDRPAPVMSRPATGLSGGSVSSGIPLARRGVGAGRAW